MSTIFHKPIKSKGIDGQQLALCVRLHRKNGWVALLSKWYESVAGGGYWVAYDIWDIMEQPKVLTMRRDRRVQIDRELLLEHVTVDEIDAFMLECWESIKPVKFEV